MKRCVFIAVYSILTWTAFGQTAGSHKLQLDFPLFDFPYQIDVTRSGDNFFSSYTNPSMRQSLALTGNIYSAFHFGMRTGYDHLPFSPLTNNIIYFGGTAGGLLLFAYVLPFGYPWMHHEFTRSILGVNNIKSSNGYYNFINKNDVTGVSDQDLADFKLAAPHDFIRMNVANLEGYVLFSERFIRNGFFYDLKDLSNVTALLASYLSLAGGSVALLAEYRLSNIDTDIEKFYQYDGDQNSRHIYYNEIINWTYELFHPLESYAERGVHPSGDGVARYIKLSQLSGEEKQYLKKQAWLGYLNLVSPVLYGFNRFPLGSTGFDWNAGFRHYLTSFGSDTAFQVLLKKTPYNMVFTLHNYMNYENYFPAIEAELLNFPLSAGKLSMQFSPRLLLGVQPKNQVFMTSEAEFMGLIGLRTDFMLSEHVQIYADFSFKTNGWAAGNEYLTGGAKAALGVSMRF